MKARITGYPYTLLDNPMYVGSTMAFLGRALGFEWVLNRKKKKREAWFRLTYCLTLHGCCRAASPIGFVLTTCIAIAYYGTLILEELVNLKKKRCCLLPCTKKQPLVICRPFTAKIYADAEKGKKTKSH